MFTTDRRDILFSRAQWFDVGRPAPDSRRGSSWAGLSRSALNESAHEGVIFRELILPVEYTNGNLKCQKMQLGEKGPDGRMSVVPIENEFETLQIDTVISAIGEMIDTEYLIQNQIP